METDLNFVYKTKVFWALKGENTCKKTTFVSYTESGTCRTAF